MIDASFISGLAQEKTATEKRRTRAHAHSLVDNGEKPRAMHIRRWLNNWQLVKKHMPEARLFGQIGTVNVWKLMPGVYLAEGGQWFKCSGSLEHAQVLAGDIDAGRNMFRINLKTGEDGCGD